ncbi:hypothetical protein HH310_06585 [Actinoplanes sp. TBRC 11911]|uniref:hypothetical protein n=1 Tax=Actinoplanes sp. TBRC 11911 TaxID=2729386 RepID=UPI00145D3C64|nr:hypothetical protein [Actinoplanes sp. TBRC 11911]NMO50859.1 hypothetical protein [Actinoplanes sp. TBRC 11911]
MSDIPYGPYGQPQTPFPAPDDPLVSADFNGWWNRSMRLLSATWRPLVMIQLLWAIPLLIITIVSNLAGQAEDTGSDGDLTAFILVGLPVIAVTFLLGLVTTLATLHVLVQHVTGHQMSVGWALRAGLSRAAAMLGWGILGGLMILVGIALCVLPGIYVSLVFMILPAVVLLERTNAIARCFRLVHAQTGPALGRIATIFAVSVVFGLVENALTSLIGGGYFAGGDDVSTGAGIFAAIVSTAVSVLSGVVIAPLVLAAYADMRARHEVFATTQLQP